MDVFEKKSIPSLILMMSIPMIISSVVQSIYNIVDRVFIGVYVNEIAIAAISVGMPLTLLTVAFSSLFAMGGNILYSRSLGAKNYEKAKMAKFTCILSAFLISILLTIPIFIFEKQIFRFLNATPEMIGYSLDYYRIFIFFIPIMILNFVLGIFCRAEGKPNLPTIVNVIGSVINVILDYVFMAFFHWGVKGAVYATILSQLITTLVLLISQSRSNVVPLNLKGFLGVRFNMIFEIIGVGLSQFFVMTGAAFTIWAANKLITINEIIKQGSYELAEKVINQKLTAISVRGSIFMIMISVGIGFGMGLVPVASYNLGAKRFANVEKSFWYTLMFCIVSSFPFWIIGIIYPQFYSNLFNIKDKEIADMAEFVIRFTFSTSLLTYATNLVGSMFQMMHKIKISLFLSFLPPISMILNYILTKMGLLYNMVWFIFIISDIFCFSVACIMFFTKFRGYMKKMKSEAIKETLA